MTVFDGMSFEEALVESENAEPWLIEGVIHSGSTLIYGQPKVGKSFLVSALIAALVSGQDFLGRPVPQDREFSVAVCWSDDGDRATYARQISEVLPEGTPAPKIKFYTMPQMKPDDWDALYHEVVAQKLSMVVIDNLTQVIDGSYKESADVNRFFAGVRKFTRSGIPVVIVGHSSDKAGPNGYPSDKPLGSTDISAAVRWRCQVKRSNRGNITLTFSGNGIPHKIIAKHGVGARFDVLDNLDSDRLEADAANRQQQRSKVRLDAGDELLTWLNTNCRGMTWDEAVAKLAADKGITAGAARSRISRAGIVKDGQVWLHRATGESAA